jgi:hypothetical protein
MLILGQGAGHHLGRPAGRGSSFGRDLAKDRSMTEVEALLSVDRGQLPPSTVAFYARDPEVAQQREYALVAALAGIAATFCSLSGADYRLVAVFVLVAAVIAIAATPTVADDDGRAQPAGKRFVTVVTSEGLIVRDAGGLRSWRFDDLAEVVVSSCPYRPQIVLVQLDGTRHALDYLSFQRGERLRDVIGHGHRSKLGSV